MQPPCGGGRSLRDISKSLQRDAEQVPPHSGPKEGSGNHAKSRICANAANDSSVLLLPRYSEAVTLLP
jgi:hypothetical protein